MKQEPAQSASSSPVPCELRAQEGPAGGAVIRLRGDWVRENRRPDTRTVEPLLEACSGGTLIRLDGRELNRWDSTLLAVLLEIRRQCLERDIELDLSGLPAGVRNLVGLATAVPQRAGIERREPSPAYLHRLGENSLSRWRNVLDTVSFIGETSCAFGRLLRGRAQCRGRDVLAAIRECGPAALPIVTLISFLVGLILAFVGAIQLRMFGAQIYVADLVGIAMIREMGAIMTGVVMAGRTGAAFAAQLGTMEVNEEIDAFRTMGISPLDFLVLPRMLGLVLMMPLLCLYADVVGILGGMVVGVTMLDLNVPLYWNETVSSVSLADVGVGVFTSVVYGILISLAGCLRGMRCGRSASAVGLATTSAVVTSIVWMVVATASITVACDILGI